MPEVIVFDLGGVLVDFAGFEQLSLMLPGETEPEELRKRWLASASIREFELGRLNPPAFSERFVTEWGLDLAPVEFLAEFETWPRGLYPGVLPLLAELGLRRRLACLSNSNEAHWRVLHDMVRGRFERCFVSFELGLLKPDPAIFDLILTSMGVAGDEVLFLDDSEPNVTAASAVGIQAEVVCGPVELRRCLVRHGLVAS